MMQSLTNTALSFLVLALIFIPLERVFPAWHGQRIFRRGVGVDAAFFLGQYMLFGMMSVAWIELCMRPLGSWHVMREVWGWCDARPVWLMAVMVWVLGDVVVYGWHRLQHRVDFLWRFHAVHHSSEEVDWLAAHREHPLDGVLTQAAVNMPAMLAGFDVGQVMGLVVFRGLWAVFIHSNVRLPLGPLAYLFGSPALHHWHHAKGRDVGNYGNLAPWMDLLCGTYYRPLHEPEEVGLLESAPRSYLGLLWYPFQPKMRGREATETPQPEVSRDE